MMFDDPKRQELVKSFNYYRKMFEIFILPNLANKLKIMTNEFLENKLKDKEIKISFVTMRSLITINDLVKHLVGNSDTFYVKINIDLEYLNNYFKPDIYIRREFQICLYKNYNKCNIETISNGDNIIDNKYIDFIQHNMLNLYNTLYADIDTYIINKSLNEGEISINDK